MELHLTLLLVALVWPALSLVEKTKSATVTTNFSRSRRNDAHLLERTDMNGGLSHDMFSSLYAKRHHHHRRATAWNSTITLINETIPPPTPTKTNSTADAELMEEACHQCVIGNHEGATNGFLVRGNQVWVVPTQECKVKMMEGELEEGLGSPQVVESASCSIARYNSRGALNVQADALRDRIKKIHAECAVKKTNLQNKYDAESKETQHDFEAKFNDDKQMIQDDLMKTKTSIMRSNDEEKNDMASLAGQMQKSETTHASTEITYIQEALEHAAKNLYKDTQEINAQMFARNNALDRRTRSVATENHNALVNEQKRISAMSLYQGKNSLNKMKAELNRLSSVQDIMSTRQSQTTMEIIAKEAKMLQNQQYEQAIARLENQGTRGSLHQDLAGTLDSQKLRSIARAQAADVLDESREDMERQNAVKIESAQKSALYREQALKVISDIKAQDASAQVKDEAASAVQELEKKCEAQVLDLESQLRLVTYVSPSEGGYAADGDGMPPNVATAQPALPLNRLKQACDAISNTDLSYNANWVPQIQSWALQLGLLSTGTRVELCTKILAVVDTADQTSCSQISAGSAGCPPPPGTWAIEPVPLDSQVGASQTASSG